MMKSIVRNIVSRGLQPLENSLLHNIETENSLPPCFIIGPPRSGTTLIYESLLVSFHLAYFSNLADRFFKVPAASTYLGRNVLEKRIEGLFVSSYGQIKGWGAPSEGGRIWNRWIPENFYLPAQKATVLPSEQIRRTIASISSTLKAPFINKNVMHSVHIELLDKLFPGCIFIEIQRDPVANIRSIVRARKHKGGPRVDYNWWSVKPLNCEQFEHASIEEQACAQVFLLRKDISTATSLLLKKRIHVINYENFCKDPQCQMEIVKEFFRKNLGIDLKRKNNIPEKFEISKSKPLSGPSEAIMSDWIDTHCEK
jgi:hypothetical protein